MELVRQYSDAEIIAFLKDKTGIDKGLKYLYDAYYFMLETAVTNNNGSKDDAADIIQETMISFVALVQNNKFRGDAGIKSVLYSITRNKWFTQLKKKITTKSQDMFFQENKDLSEKEIIHDIVYTEHQNTIQDFFKKLGETCRKLLLLVYYEDLSMREIAEKMPEYQNEQVIRNKKYKCMKELEKILSENDTLKTELKIAFQYGR